MYLHVYRYYFLSSQIFSVSSCMTAHANFTSLDSVREAHTANLKKKVSLTLDGTMCIRRSSLIVFNNLSLTSFEP